MEFEPIDRNNEPETDEFEKLEFLPEQPADPAPEPDDTAEIIFAPEEASNPEPPVSFSTTPDSESTDEGFAAEPQTPQEVDFGAGTPFELFGTSLFDDPELDDDFGDLDPDPLDDDLEF